MKIFYKSEKRKFSAEAEYRGNKVIVMKGSTISKKIDNFRISKVALTIRMDTKIVSTEYRLLKDVEFKSLSTAAQFVSGASVNGLKVWKCKNGEPIKNKI